MLFGRERGLYFMGCLEKRSREKAAIDRQYLTQNVVVAFRRGLAILWLNLLCFGKLRAEKRFEALIL